ncbi:MAG: glycosyltransferase family 2 protein, partial [Bacillota bacterium]|nr:glycosyltransferase family 2 protein [Bacillota bacterium]
DHYFCLKLKRLGFDIIRVENAILLHSLGNSIPKSILGQKITVTNHSPLRRYYMTRNRLYTWKEFKKDFPEWYKEDLGRFINETIKIILYEDRKLSKLRSIMGGVLDYGKKVMGKKENR